jgi:membrane associated rhomboid family serine protease
MATPEQTQAQVCYRHPGRETGVSCSSCGRPICPDCMVYAAVGIKCPECAGQPTGARAASRRVRARAGAGTGPVVTKTIIGLTVFVFLVQVVQSAGGISNPLGGQVVEKGVLFGPAVAAGDWWRLVTGAFLHASLIHVGLNMLMLWWFGQALESALGRARFAGIYLVSILAGSAGALLFAPTEPVVGASGGVFGILGAGLVLERRNINVFGGGALLVVLLNLGFTLIQPSNVSIGGHLGGLAGGALAILALSRFGRGNPVYGRLDPLTVASFVGIALASIAVAYLRVRGLA